LSIESETVAGMLEGMVDDGQEPASEQLQRVVTALAGVM
jgi:hypothetical protein